MQNLVFLDFDDVLAVHHRHTSRQVVAALSPSAPEDVPELWQNIFDEHLRENLRVLYEEFRPKFVISSTWATYLSRAQVTDVLTRGGLGFVAASLHPHWRSATELGSFRVSDISKWFESERRDLYNYVILDDVASGASLYGSPFERRAVFCAEWEGFVDVRLIEAQHILNTQQK